MGKRKFKKKAGNCTRFMTWNAHGLDSALKRQKLKQFVKDEEIDVLVVQEGNAQAPNPIDESCTIPSQFVFKPEEADLQNLFSATNGVVSPVGGKKRKTPYNTIFNPSKWRLADDSEEVDYAKVPAIREWIKRPYTEAVEAGKIRKSGTAKRQKLEHEEGASALEEVRDSIKRRVNMLSQQRPKCLKSVHDGRRAFYFHAPLGGEVRLDSAGLDKIGNTDFAPSSGAGSGGQLAPAVNVLFRMAIAGFNESTQQVNDMPEDVIYLADSNVRAGGMDVIFPGTNRGTSGDGLCHIVSGAAMEIISTERDEVAVGPSDHDWVIADVRNPT